MRIPVGVSRFTAIALAAESAVSLAASNNVCLACVLEQAPALDLATLKFLLFAEHWTFNSSGGGTFYRVGASALIPFAALLNASSRSCYSCRVLRIFGGGDYFGDIFDI